MVNNPVAPWSPPLRAVGALVTAYVVIVAGTIVALAVLSAANSALATTEAWVHAVIVAAFAVLLPLRVRAAASGGRGGLRAVGLIGAALLLVNMIEALIPGLFPVWLRLVMIAIAVLMAAMIGLVVRAALIGRRG